MTRSALTQSEPALPMSALPRPREAPDASVEVADIWWIIWRRRLLVAAVAAVLVALAAAYGLLTPAQYSAHGQILIDPRDRVVVANDVNPAAMSPDGGVAQVESQTKVLESSGVLLRAIEMLNLEEDDEFGVRPSTIASLGGTLRSLLGLPPAAAPKGEASAIVLRAIRQKLGIQRADKVFVIDVAMTARDPDKAAEIVNAILKSYLADQAQARTDAAVEASQSLTGGLERQRDKVREAESALERYKAENGIVEANNLLVSDQELARLASQLSAAEASTALLRTRIRRSSDDAATAEAMTSATISQLRSQEATLVQQMSALQRQFGPRHPSLRNAALQLSDLRQLIAGELARLKRSSSNDYARALAYETSLADALAAAKVKKAESDQLLIGMRALERDLDVNRTVYASFSQRAQETGDQSGIDSTNARVISWALPPLDKSWPKTTLFVVAAAAAGLGLGVFAALLAEYRAPTIVSRIDMRRISGASELGLISLDRARRRRWSWPRSRARRSFHRETDVAMARALQLLQGASGGGRSIFLTSGDGENEERVTIVLMLATIALRLSKRVLFIDGSSVELSNPQSPGLLEILRGEQSLASAITIDHATGLAVLGRGQGVIPGGGGNGFERVLAEACSRFDLVLIDGCVITEDLGALPIAGGADEVVFVARLGATRREEVTMAADVLSTLGRRISATLLIKPASLV